MNEPYHKKASSNPYIVIHLESEWIGLLPQDRHINVEICCLLLAVLMLGYELVSLSSLAGNIHDDHIMTDPRKSIWIVSGLVSVVKLQLGYFIISEKKDHI